MVSFSEMNRMAQAASSNAPIIHAVVSTPMGAFKLVYDSADLLYRSASIIQSAINNRHAIGGGLEAAAAGLMVTTGGVLTVPVGVALGAKAVYDLTKWYFGNGGDDKVKELIDRAKAHNDLIQMLSSTNDAHLANMQSGLTRLEANIQDLTGRVAEIQKVADHGLQGIAEQKERGVRLFEEAENISMEAKQSMEAGKKFVEIANAQLTQAIKKLAVVIDLAQEEGEGLEDRVDRIAKLALELRSEIAEAQSNLIEGQNAYARGEDLNQVARVKEREGHEIIGAVVEASKTALEQISHVAQYGTLQSENQALKSENETLRGEVAQKGVAFDELQKQLNDGTREIRDLTDRVRENNTGIMSSAEDQARVLAELEQVAGNNFGAVSICAGLFTAAFASPVVGPAGAAAAGAVGMKVVHDARRGRKVQVSELPKEQAEKLPKGSISYRWAAQSTGYGGYLIGKQSSSTAGAVDVVLPTGDAIKIGFNLNKGGPNSVDISKLAKELNAKFTEGTMTAEECLDVISKLKALKVDRGVRGHGWLQSGEVPLFPPAYSHVVLDNVEEILKKALSKPAA